MKKISIKFNSDFITYSAFNFLEKFLAYVAPLVLLKLIGNQDLYNKI
jgi:hypothetical protein